MISRMRLGIPARLAVVALAATLVSSCAQHAETRLFPNAPVILISIDTLRSDHLPTYGYTKIETPYIDRFRSQAILYEHAYTPCPMTLPAHVTELTGLLPFEHGVRNNLGFTFDGSTHPSLPRLLKQHGYATGAAVSSYVLRSDTGLGALFDYYEDSTDPRPGIAAVHYRRAGDKTAAVAEKWIGAHRAEPFFFFFHIYEPHLPYDPPEPFLSRYGKTYDGAIATADATIGSFLDDLRTLGVYDRAIIVLTGDHGEGLGDHGEEQHSILLYREALQVPLMLKLPGSLDAGRSVNTPAQLSDIVPAITALLGLPKPEQVSGTSLLDLDDKREAGRVIYAETLYPRLQLGWSDLHSVLDAHYQYIGGPRPELYDLVQDPREKNDLVGSKAQVAERMASELERFPQGNTKPSAVDAETLRRLSSLGYIGGLNTGSDTSAPLPNPVDNLQYLERMRVGWQLADQKKYLQAIEALHSIVRDNPGMIEVWIKLGEVYADLGLDEQAAATYREALARSPIFLPDLSVSLGEVELRLKHYAEAEEAAQNALTGTPSKAQDLLAQVALEQGQFAVALQRAKEAAGGGNLSVPAMLVLAEVYLRSGQPFQALEVLDRTQERARAVGLSTIYDLDYLRGDALARLKRFDEAVAAFQREIAEFPSHARAYSGLAVLRFMRGDRAGVDALLEKMASANPSRRTYLIAAATLEAFGEKDKAAAWRARAQSIGGSAPATP
jgi:arylsulfatase A-like enzyme/predicted negative regulator of RcsB-dependent stress response